MIYVELVILRFSICDYEDCKFKNVTICIPKSFDDKRRELLVTGLCLETQIKVKEQETQLKVRKTSISKEYFERINRKLEIKKDFMCMYIIL
jgi:hypothetical protein